MKRQRTLQEFKSLRVKVSRETEMIGHTTQDGRRENRLPFTVYRLPSIVYLFLLTSYFLLLASSSFGILYAGEFKLEWVRPRIMTIGSQGFNDKIFFRFIPEHIPEGLKLSILTIDGKKVKEIIYPNRSEHTNYEIAWDGKNSDGSYVLPGVYIYQFETGKKIVNGAIVVAR